MRRYNQYSVCIYKNMALQYIPQNHIMISSGETMTQALIFSIEEFSIHDGPGIRATVFLKGCPLRCEWCHNPEGQRFENEIIKSQAGCENCGACVKAGGGRLTEKSVRVCPNRLLRMSGETYTPERLLEKLRWLLPMLNDAGGGVTFSGGEPLAHPDFLQETLALLEGQTPGAIAACAFDAADQFYDAVRLSIRYRLSV